MSIFSLLMTLLKELMPFLKESLLEGQTFRIWFKTNWLTFAWLANMLALTLIIAYQSDAITLARKNERAAQRSLQEAKLPIEKLITRYKKLKTDNARMSTELNQKEKDLIRYVDWLNNCGVNVTTGQCPVVRPPPVKPKPRSKSKPVSSPKPTHVTPAEEDKPSFFRKLRNIFTRNNKEQK